MSNNQKGIAIISVIYLSMVVVLLGGALLMSTYNTHQRTQADRVSHILRNVAEMGVAQIQTALRDYYVEYQDLELTPEESITDFTQEITVCGKTINLIVDATKSKESVPTKAIFDIVSTAVDLSSSEDPEKRDYYSISFKLNLEGDIVSKFFIFTIRDLELHPGPDMTLQGDIHAQGGIFLNPLNKLNIGTTTDATKYFHAEGEILRRDKFDYRYENFRKSGTVRIKGEIMEVNQDSTQKKDYSYPFRPNNDPSFDFDTYCATHWGEKANYRVVKRHVTPIAAPGFRSLARNGFYHEESLKPGGGGIAIIDDQVWLEGNLIGILPQPQAPVQLPLTFCEATSAQNLHPGTHACDGNLSTYWYTNTNMPQSITFDLGEPKEIGKFSLSFYYYNYRSYNYSIAVSNDKTTWTTVVDKVWSTSSQWQEHDFAGITARFIRVNCINNNSSTKRAGIYEVKAFAPIVWLGSPPPFHNAIYFMPNPDTGRADSFYEYREQRYARALTIDIGNLNNYLATINFTRDKYVIYASYRLPEGEPALPVVFIRNGGSLRSHMTIASENPLYISGNYNHPKTYDSCIVAEAITIVSAGFNVGSAQQRNEPASQSEIFINSILVGGNMDTYYEKPDGTIITTEAAQTNSEKAATDKTRVHHNGGFHNFVRFLEDWTNKTVNIKGAFIDMFDTVTIDGEFIDVPSDSNCYYRPPIRNWAYDVMPEAPLVPKLTKITVSDWHESKRIALKMKTWRE